MVKNVKDKFDDSVIFWTIYNLTYPTNLTLTQMELIRQTQPLKEVKIAPYNP